MEQVVIEAPSAEEAIVSRAVAAREQGEKSSWREADCYADLAQRGWTQQRIAERCGVHRVRVSRFIACSRTCSVPNNRPSFWEAFSKLPGQTKDAHNHRAQGTGENEWYTPAKYIEAARDVLGTIDLDPASSASAQDAVGAERYFTIEQDGLAQEWHGRVWLNPPYAQPAIARFIEKAVNEYEAGRVAEAIVLTHSYTDTAWFHAAAGACTSICFTRGRIGFLSPEGVPAAPTQGQAFLYFGADPGKFVSVFSAFGLVVMPI